MAGPDGGGQDGGWVRRVGQAVRVPPVGATLALEERGAGVLFACVLSAGVAGFRDVGRVEFGVGDGVEDLDGVSAEASCSLFLDFVVGAGFWGPVHEELADGPDWSAAPVSSCSGHV